MRQRVMIAMALACDPKLLHRRRADHRPGRDDPGPDPRPDPPLSEELGTAVILITHDLGVVAGMCDRVNVMYAGRIVERRAWTTLFGDPRHPYTMGLLRVGAAPGRGARARGCTRSRACRPT